MLINLVMIDTPIYNIKQRTLWVFGYFVWPADNCSSRNTLDEATTRAVFHFADYSLIPLTGCL